MPDKTNSKSKSKQVVITEAITTAHEDRITGKIDGHPFVIITPPGGARTNPDIGKIIAANFNDLVATEITTISKTFRVDLEEQVVNEGAPPVWVFIRTVPG